ncbi:MAG TPA: PaaI family thioesterase [Bradyrhizobium sp.]|nr:PaaI family thioesterase [Bradyrhizobium sp.]
MRYLDASLTKIEPGYCEIRMPYRPELTQQHGFFHAGATAAIVDSACGYASFGLMPADASVLTVEYKINLLSPGRGEVMVARGHVIRNGRTLKICRGKAFGVTNGEETLCVESLSTIMTLVGREDR